MQAEVKKAWLRRSLVLDLKQKARITSSAGGGSCYYGGMMSHTTTHSICLSAANPRALPFAGGVVGSGGASGCAGSGVRLARHISATSPHHLNSLRVYISGDGETLGPQQGLAVWKPEGTEAGVFTRDAKPKGDEDCKRHGEKDPISSLSLKELETIL